MVDDYKVYFFNAPLSERLMRLNQQEDLAIGLICDSIDDLTEAIDVAITRFPTNTTTWIVTRSGQVDISTIRQNCPSANILEFIKPFSFASAVNSLLSECTAKAMLIMPTSANIERININEAFNCVFSTDKPSVVAPLIKSSSGYTIPCLTSPRHNGVEIAPLPLSPEPTLSNTFYPMFGMGIYRRDAWELLGGMNESIKTPYWQIIDYASKSWLKWRPLRLLPSFVIKWRLGQDQIEDISNSEDASFVNTFVMAVMKENAGAAHLRPFSSLIYNRKALKELKESISSYKTDFLSLIQSWQFKPHD